MMYEIIRYIFFNYDTISYIDTMSYHIKQYHIVLWYTTALYHVIGYGIIFFFRIDHYQHIFIANYPWFGSAKVCSLPYSHFCYFRLLINFTIITYKEIFNYSLRTSSHTCWNTKGLSRCSGTGIFFPTVFIYKYRYCSHSWNIQTLRIAKIYIP